VKTAACTDLGGPVAEPPQSESLCNTVRPDVGELR
jgi:hypothetical protein